METEAVLRPPAQSEDRTPAAELSGLSINEQEFQQEGVDVERNNMQPAIKVLTYHRIVGDLERLEYPWTVTQSQFRNHLGLLNRWGYTCVNFKDVFLFTRGKLRLPKKPVIITFDDGYAGVYRYALPVIRQFGITATAFVLGDRSIESNYWDKSSGFEEAMLMTDDNILELQECGFEIGSHSMSHSDLTRMSGNRALEEISRSKGELEDLTGNAVITFAYPFGALNPDLENMVKDAGYSFGCGVYSGPPKFAQDVYNIRRISITRRTNTIDFGLKVLTPFEYYQWAWWETGQWLGVRKENVFHHAGIRTERTADPV